MRQVTIFVTRIGLLDPVLRAARNDPDLHEALFEAVSAHGSYRDVLRKTMKPGTIWAIFRAVISGSKGGGG
jgi:hypothetical protein